MSQSRVKNIQTQGQSIWLDDIHRAMLNNGHFQKLMDEDGIRGVTSNPAILEKAISEHDDYADDIKSLQEEGKTALEIYERLVLQDLRQAADMLRPVFDAADGHDGMVSMEVSPRIAYDTEATLKAARRLWKLFDRPNAMIKIPATQAGLPAIQQLTAEGININVTLLFSQTRYQAVQEAFVAGLEARLEEQESISEVVSVASFFISRIDSNIDQQLQAHEEHSDLMGEAAVSLAHQCYQDYQIMCNSDRWTRLSHAGGKLQRLLWASTSVKNPQYSDVKYVERLIGPNTVNTLPQKTLNAFRDHGETSAGLLESNQASAQVLEQLNETGIDLQQTADTLEQEGVQKFIDAFERLLKTIEN
ncbi:MAG: transaldolase [gamma proteobacterium symbiont of Bathyaustriella thionipta]|nr:transaldolase [gamma proteobacterium symbiont of Bathyaustriella thionipta]